MANQRILENLYRLAYADEIQMEDELQHHGVVGMEWGEKNGPPYPLANINKSMARAAYKLKKQKDRELKKLQKAKAKRMKKLQKAAKKARKEKKKQEEEAAAIQKKKQMLVKEGNMDKIRKNAELFTNEELEYILERDAQKRALGSQEQRDKEEKLNIAMARIAQVADIAVSAGKVFQGVKDGANMIAAFKDVKLKDAQVEESRMRNIKTEFEMRFKGREDSREAQEFIDATTGNERYSSPPESKSDKKARKAEERLRQEQIRDDEKLIRETRKVENKEARADLDRRSRAADEYFKEAKASDKRAKEEAKANKKSFSWPFSGNGKNEQKVKEQAQKTVEKSGHIGLDYINTANASKNYSAGSDPRDWSTSFFKQQAKSTGKQQQAASMLRKDLAADLGKSTSPYMSGIAQTAAKKVSSSAYTSAGSDWTGSFFKNAKNSSAQAPAKTISSGAYTSAGSNWVNGLFSSSGYSGSTYQTRVPYSVTPQKKGGSTKQPTVQQVSAPKKQVTAVLKSSGGKMVSNVPLSEKQRLAVALQYGSGIPASETYKGNAGRYGGFGSALVSAVMSAQRGEKPTYYTPSKNTGWKY